MLIPHYDTSCCWSKLFFFIVKIYPCSSVDSWWICFQKYQDRIPCPFYEYGGEQKASCAGVLVFDALGEDKQQAFLTH